MNLPHRPQTLTFKASVAPRGMAPCGNEAHPTLRSQLRRRRFAEPVLTASNNERRSLACFSFTVHASPTPKLPRYSCKHPQPHEQVPDSRQLVQQSKQRPLWPLFGLVTQVRSRLQNAAWNLEGGDRSCEPFLGSCYGILFKLP